MDSGALVALERGDRAMWRRFKAALVRGEIASRLVTFFRHAKDDAGCLRPHLILVHCVSAHQIFQILRADQDTVAVQWRRGAPVSDAEFREWANTFAPVPH